MDNPTEPAPALECAPLWLCPTCGRLIGYVVQWRGFSCLEVITNRAFVIIRAGDVICQECGTTSEFCEDARAREWRQRALERKYNPKRGG